MSISWSRYFTPEAADLLQKCIDIAFAEDGPDLTSRGIFAPDAQLHGILRAKEQTIIAGLPLVGIILKRIGQPFTWKPLVAEGALVEPQTHVAQITAQAETLLKAERVILNYLTHLSGVANLTAQYVKQLHGTGVRLLDTRKTLPGMRWLEKYAVQLGGGHNHRMSLTDMLMLKDNHIDGAGSIGKAVSQLRSLYRPCPPIEVECRSKEDVQEALKAHADRIMLDNMQGQYLSEALALIPANVEAEVSGGVTLENIHGIALTSPRPPDFISVGRLTHSAAAADLSLTLEQIDTRN